MASWVMRFLTSAGYPALVLLAALECIFPPIPSELIFPLAGFLARQGKLTIWGSVLAGAAGGTFGALPLYFAGRTLGLKRVERFVEHRGRWAAISTRELERSRQWFDRHVAMAVLLAHLVPGLRSLIAVPAGIQRMHLPKFLLLTAIGAAIWVAILCGAGYALGAAFGNVERWLDPVSWVVVALVAGLYVWRVVRGSK